MNLWKGRQWFKFWMCENVISWMSSMKIECPRSWRLIHNIFFSIKWEYNWRVLAWDEMRCYRIQQLPVFYCNSVTKQYNYTIIHKITDIMTTNARCFFFKRPWWGSILLYSVLLILIHHHHSEWGSHDGQMFDAGEHGIQHVWQILPSITFIQVTSKKK